MPHNTDVKIRLQGHEKFALREGWLNKGLIATVSNPTVFQKDGTDILGVGTNMVKSIRFWMNAFGLISENQRTGASLTELGRLIYDYDENFEDIFTLWILHFSIIKNRKEATSWHIFFNKCEVDSFEKKDIANYMHKELFKYVGNSNFSDNSLNSDIDVILNMYSKGKKVDDPEDKNISPFARLGLLKKEGNEYLKKQPDQRNFNEWIVLYVLSDLLRNDDSISIDAALMSEDGLVRMTQMNSIVINEYLDRLDAMGYIRVNRTAGLDVIYKNPDNNIDTKEVIEKYYLSREN